MSFYNCQTEVMFKAKEQRENNFLNQGKLISTYVIDNNDTPATINDQ